MIALLSLLLSADWVCTLEKTTPPLPAASYRVLRVGDAAGLKQALESDPQDVTILVADGVYTLSEPVSMRKGQNVILRGASGDAGKATLRGRGFLAGKPGDDLLQVGNVQNLTIAYLTFADCRSYGIKVEAEHFPRDVHIYGCHFRDIGVRMIKGSSSREGKAVGGSIRFCRFENTQIPPADWLFDGDYITAIDMMALEGWIISDNFFSNIKGRKGGARGAIFIWVRSRNVTVERNAILNCDRGISFGNPSGSTNYLPGQEHVQGSIIRNNIIVPGPDAGIELWWADDIRVYNNTIWRADAAGPGMRGGMDDWKIKRIDVANNLVRGVNLLEGEVTLRNNLFGDLSGHELALLAGGPQLRGIVPEAIGRGLPLKEVPDDYRGRAREKTTNIGALGLDATTGSR
jgi:hypothetical protein